MLLDTLATFIGLRFKQEPQIKHCSYECNDEIQTYFSHPIWWEIVQSWSNVNILLAHFISDEFCNIDV